MTRLASRRGLRRQLPNGQTVHNCTKFPGKRQFTSLHWGLYGQQTWQFSWFFASKEEPLFDKFTTRQLIIWPDHVFLIVYGWKTWSKEARQRCKQRSLERHQTRWQMYTEEDWDWNLDMMDNQSSSFPQSSASHTWQLSSSGCKQNLEVTDQKHMKNSRQWNSNIIGKKIQAATS